MQRSICRLVGACGLIFTFTAAAYGASAGAAGGGAVGGAAASGGTATTAAGAGRAAPAATRAPAPSAQAQAPSTAPGQSVSTVPGQNVSVAPPTIGAAGQPVGVAGQPVQGQTAATPATTQLGATTGNGIATTSGVGAIGTTTTTTGTRTTVSFNTLPQTLQSQIAAQIPAGSQLGNIIAETTPQGTIYRAQVMQNGVISEVPLTGLTGTPTALPGVIRGATTTGFATATTTGTTAADLAATTTGILPTGGFVVGTAYPLEQLPVGVQGAFAAQGAAAAGTTATYSQGANGGVFRAMVDGRPIDVRVGANGQVIPTTTRAVATTTNTNAMRLDDLPMAVRDAIRNSAPLAEVTTIRKTESASGNLFDVSLRENDRLTLMRLSENGTIINPRKELAADVTATAAVVTNEPPKLAWNSLPVAVRDAISVETQPDAIRSLVLTNYQGKTAYAVDYVDRDALRNRIYVGKEGVIVDTQTNIFGIASVGRAVVLEDLPAPARAVVERQAEKSAITRIDLAMQGLTPVYVVSFQHDGEARQMVVSRDGHRVDSAAGAPAVTTVGSEKGQSASEQKSSSEQK